MTGSISRIAMAVALSLGVVGVASFPQQAQAQVKLSKGFQSHAVELQKAVNAGKEDAAVQAASERAKQARTAVVSARDEAAQAQAQAQLQAAQAEINQQMGGIRGKLDQALAAVEKPDDRLFGGQMALNVGQMMADPALQKRGIDLMLASGQLEADVVPQYTYYSGALAYDAGDYAGAREGFTRAIAAGHTGDDIHKLLAEAYFADNMNAEGLVKLDEAITARQAAGLEVGDEYAFRGLAVAANNQMNDRAFPWAMRVLESSPRPDYRNQAYAVLRTLAPFTPEEELDLLRLMQRADALSARRDYLAYLQIADARRRPGEVRSLLESGVSSGILQSGDTTVTEARTTVGSRYDSVLNEIAADATRARADTSGAEALAIADVYLGYRKPVEAEGLYRAALDKGGINREQALTGLGIALADQGKLQEAKDTFAQINAGNRSMIARAWLAYIDSQMAAGG